MKTKGLIAFLVLVGFPVVGLADWEVSPLTYDYGDVEVGASSSMVFTITNLCQANSLLITGVQVLQLSGEEFTQTGGPTGSIELGFTDETRSIDIEVTFTPSDEAIFTGYLYVTSLDANSDEVVVLTGTGVESEPPPEQVIQDILDFIDAAVDAGTLEGCGPGNSANNRLNALINMIEAAGDLIEDGFYEQAYDQLQTVYQKCDGVHPPPDFVEGPAREELAQMILDLMAVLELLMI